MSTSSPPRTPSLMEPLSRELEAAIAKRNLLTARSRSRLLSDLGAAAAEGEDRLQESLRARAVRELVDSERSYLRHLQMVEEFFMRPLQERSWLPRSDFVSIFGDLPSIIQVNGELLSCLEGSEDRVGKVFLDLAPYLKFYSTYAQEFQTSAALVERWSEQNSRFKQFLEAQETRPEVQLKLNALLITPVQRIPRYKMLLEDVIKNTPENHPDKDNLEEALRQIESVAWHINDQLKEHENALKMLDIQRSLQGCFPKIVVPGRRLVKQGNLMKVPRAGGSGNPRYFVLFSDMLMYCKIKIAGVDKLLLPKTNSLECGCMMPLKHTKVEALVGKGLFKVSCKGEELILYSQDGGNTSESWVDCITEAAEKHKRDAATLRKESSRREPIRRPELLKMRRESLSQIMINATKCKKAAKENQPAESSRKGRLLSPKRLPFSSPRKKRPLEEGASSNLGESPSKLRRQEEDDEKEHPLTPRRSERIARSAKDKERSELMPAPKAGESVKKRTHKIVRPKWKTLSVTRKDKLKEEERPKAASELFRSPSVYNDESPRKRGGGMRQQGGGSTSSSEESSSVMSSYLSGKICPLTPSQRQTDISHLVNKELKERFCTPPPANQPLGSQGSQETEEEEGHSRALVTLDYHRGQSRANNDSGGKGFCTVM